MDAEPFTRFRQRNLPHLEVGGSWYFLTFRLANSLPSAIAAQWREERNLLREKEQLAAIPAIDAFQRACLLAKKFDEQLDRGDFGPRHLASEPIATLVMNSLRFYDGTRYRLGPLVVMPNHVHVLLQPLAPTSVRPFGLDQIMHGIKGYSGKEANKFLQMTGAFWQREYYDHLVRDQDEWSWYAAYIQNNPVAAGLCLSPDGWRWRNESWTSP